MLKVNKKGLLALSAPGWSGWLVPAALCGVLMTLPPAMAQELSLGGGMFVESTLEQTVEQTVEEQVKDRVEEAVEERLLTLGGDMFESAVEDAVQDAVQDAVEDGVQDAVEDAVQDAVQDNITDNIEITLEGNIEDEIQQDVEEAIDDLVEETVEGTVEDRIEETVADNLTQSVESAVEATVEATVEEEVAASVEQAVESTIASSVESAVEQGVEAGVESAVEQSVEAGVESAVEVDIESQVATNVEERVEDTIDQIIERMEVDESRIQKNQWLVMAAPEVFEQLAAEGYLFGSITDLPGMGLRLAEVAAPSSFDISKVRQGVIDVVGSDKAEVDLNHIYTAGDPVSELGDLGVPPRAAIDLPPDMDSLPLRIGMIDSSVDVTHPALAAAHIQSRAFTTEGAEMPSYHGTAIASIIVADSAEFVGIAPRSEVYAAAVFEQDPQRGEIASTVSLVRALDWLISSGVDVINISLAGPPNRLLEAALQRATEHNVMILAAAGNGGPVAQPMYPAAYPTVVAVTAVDTAGRIFRLANRGEYLDISAPGVDMRHARSGGGYAASSGTSFAVPFASTAVARLRQLQPGSDVLTTLYRAAEDLGPPGRDSIYGYGLLRPEKT